MILYSKWGYSSYHLELNCLCLCAGLSYFDGNLTSFVCRVPFLSITFSDSHLEIEAVIRDPNSAFQSTITVHALLTATRRNVSVVGPESASFT